MKKHFYTCTLLLCAFLFHYLPATAQEGDYLFSGYFFHPTSSRAISGEKIVVKINDSTYQTAIGDLYGSGYLFNFQIDANNKLVNWHAVGTTPLEPASGFMTVDNPGNFSYYPDTTQGFTSDVYNNTYDPATRTFYFHYGYGVNSTGQSGYSRQIYETVTYFRELLPLVYSVSPDNGTTGTEVTITGKYFTGATQVRFGGRLAADFTVVSDSVVTAIVGSGLTGSVQVYNADITAFTSSVLFTYTPPVVTDTTWKPAGNAGFSAGAANFVSIATAPGGLPYVVYQDGANSNKAMVMKLDSVSGTWQAVGNAPSAGATSYTNIAIGSDGVPYIAYVDSSINRNVITVQRFVNNAWEYVGKPGFDSVVAPYGAKVALALDSANHPYVLSMSGSTKNYNVHALYFDGSGWQSVGGLANYNLPFVSGQGDADLAIDKATNSVYVVSDKSDSGYQATVVKFANGSWSTIGSVFGGSKNGAFYPSIKIDRNGTPLVSMQDDDGRERVSVYRFSGSSWQPVGDPYFSNGHCYYVAMALDGNNTPYVLYQDYSYNALGTVMKNVGAGDTTSTGWVTVGARGFANSAYYTAHAIAYSGAGHIYIAFPDSAQGYKVTVLQVDAPPSSILPVALLSFSATATNNRSAMVNWQTSNEVNAASFIIQRSTDGVHFTNIGKVAATGTGGTHTYNYQDNLSGISAEKVYYQLLMTDKDGSSKQSKIVSVAVNSNKLITLQPNPARNYAVVTCNVAGKKTITVTDMNGRNVFTKTTANNSETINVASFAKGMYMVRTTYAGGVSVQKLLVE